MGEWDVVQETPLPSYAAPTPPSGDEWGVVKEEPLPFDQYNKALEDQAMVGQRAYEGMTDLGESSQRWDADHPTFLRDAVQKVKTAGQVGANLGMGLVSFPLGLAAGAGALVAGEGMEGFKKRQEKVGEFFTPNVGELTPEAGAALETVGKITGAPSKALGAGAAAIGGEGWRAGGEVAGDVLLMFAPLIPKAVRVFKGSEWYRGMTIPERGLVAQSLDDMIKRGYSEGEILRKWDNPSYRESMLEKIRDEEGQQRIRDEADMAAIARAGGTIPPGVPRTPPRPAQPQAAPNFELVGKPYGTDPNLNPWKVIREIPLLPAPASGAPGADLPATGPAPTAGGEPPPLAPSQPLRAEPDTGPTGTDVIPNPGEYPVARIPVDQIQANPKELQFKLDVNASGEQKPLAGDWNDLASGNLLLWQDKGGTLYVANGHHRLALAKRTGQKEVNAQVLREADGISINDARGIAAESNILEGKGTIYDQAEYFRTQPEYTAEVARKRGIETKGYAVGKLATANTYDLFRDRKITPQAATEISSAAPGNESLQAVGIKFATAHPKADPGELTHFIKAIELQRAPQAKGEQVDLFGFDDAAIRSAEQSAKKASKIIKDLREDLNAISGASRRPDRAKKLGVDITDPKSVATKAEQLKAEIESWNKWYNDPEKIAKVEGREFTGMVAEPAPIFGEAPAPKRAKGVAPGQEKIDLQTQEGPLFQPKYTEPVKVEATFAPKVPGKKATIEAPLQGLQKGLFPEMETRKVIEKQQNLFKESQKPFASDNVRIEETTAVESLKKEAEKHGVTYKGEWTFGGKKFADNYTDKLTNGDFSVMPGGSLKDAILKHRKMFVEAGNIDKSGLSLAEPKKPFRATLTTRIVPHEGAGTKIVYSKDGKVVGTGQLLGKEIPSIHVKEEYRNQGIGQEIMKDLISRGGERGYPATEAGKRLMAKAGMKDIGGAQLGFEPRKEYAAIREALLKQRGHQYDFTYPIDLGIATRALASLKRVEALPFVKKTGLEGAGNKTLGNAISNELINRSWIDFEGREVKNLDELIALAQVYRNPEFETHRWILGKKLPGGAIKILSIYGLTSKIPGQTRIFEKEDFTKELYRLKARIKRVGADVVHSLHNHPSGDVKSSQEDRDIDRFFSLKYPDGGATLPEFQGVLIIDHEKYNLFKQDPLGYGRIEEVRSLSTGAKDPLLTPSIDHPLIGAVVNSPAALALALKGLVIGQNRSVIFFMQGGGKINGIHDVHNSTVKRDDFIGYLRNRSREFGSQSPIIITKDVTLRAKLLDFYKKGHLKEVAIVRANGIESFANTIDPFLVKKDENQWMGKPATSVHVASPVINYGAADPRHIDLNDKLVALRKDLSGVQRERDHLDSKVRRLDRHIDNLKTMEAKRINAELMRRARIQLAHRKNVVKDLIGKIGDLERDISRLGVGTNTIVKRRQIGEKKEGRFAPPVTQKEFEIIKEMAQKPPMKGALREWFETAPRMWDHYGKKAKELFYRHATAARFEAHKETIAVFKQIDQQFKKLPGKASRRIGIHAIAQQPRGMALLKEAGIDKVPTLTPEELASYKWARTLLSDTYWRLQEARKIAGEKPFPPVQDYFSFMRNLNFWDRWGLSPATADLGALQDIPIHLRSTAFRFAKRRIGGTYPVEVDARFILKNYMKSALTHIHMGPEISKMRELVGLFKSSEGEFLFRDANPLAYSQIVQWIDYVSGVQPPSDIPEIFQKIIKGLSRNIVASTLAFSIRSTLIQPTSLLQAWSRLGTTPMLRAVPALLHPSEWRRALEQSHHLSPRIMDIALDRAVEELWGPVARAKAKATGAGFYALGALDYVAANYTWLAAEQAGKKAGLSGPELINFADDITVATQGSGAREDISRIQRTVLGHAMMLFQTFSINQWGFFLRDTLGINTAEKLSKREIFRRLLYFLVGATAINTVYEDLLGMPSPLPTPFNTYLRAKEEGKTTSEALIQSAQNLAGMIPGWGGMRFGNTMLGAGADWVQDVVKKGAQWGGGMKGSYVKPAPEIAMRGLGIPGTSQLYKTVRGLDKGLSLPEALVGTTKSSMPGKAPVRGATRRTMRRPGPEPDTLHKFMGIRAPRQALKRGG